MGRSPSNNSRGQSDWKPRHFAFLLVLVFLVFQNNTENANSSTSSSQQAASTNSKSYFWFLSRSADRFDMDTEETLIDFSEVEEESRRDEMTIRFANETWVTEWRDVQAAMRAKKPIRNADWSKIKCIDSTQNEWDTCDLSDDRWGVSVLFLTLPRSGAVMTWELLSSLASERGQNPTQDLAPTTKGALQQLEQINPKEHGKCWLERILCRHQYNNKNAIKEGFPKAELTGTIWKAHLQAFNHTKFREALSWLAGNPHIKVVWNERNFLDSMFWWNFFP